MFDRISSVAARLSPWLIIGGLAYAALFVQVDGATGTMRQPLVESRDLFFGGAAADGRLWFVGQAGAVLSMNEQARQWERSQLQPVANLQGIAASDAGVLVAVGNGGQLWVRDRGGRWTSQSLPVGEVGNKLIDVAFLDGHFWVVGEMGALFRADANGANWTRLRDAVDVAFSRVRSGPSGSIWVAAEFGHLLHSRDGGSSWSSVQLGNESLQSIAFAGEEGVVVGNRGQAFHSIDGGESWQPVPAFTTEHLYDVIARQDGWLVAGDRGALFSASRPAADWRPLAPEGSGKRYRTRLLATQEGHVLIGSGIGLLDNDGNYRAWPMEVAR